MEFCRKIVSMIYREEKGGVKTYGAATGPGGEDGAAGSKDVDDAAVVGEAGAAVGGVGGTDGAGLGGGGGGVVGGIGVVVAGSDGKENVVVDHGGSSLVKSGL